MKLIKKITKYINDRSHKLVNVYNRIKGFIISFHEKLFNEGYYTVIFHEFFTVFITGFLISVALIPFISIWNPRLSLSYGLIPWIIIQLAVYTKRELK